MTKPEPAQHRGAQTADKDRATTWVHRDDVQEVASEAGVIHEGGPE